MQKTRTDYTRLTINLEPDYLVELKKLAKREGLPVGIFLRLRIHQLVNAARGSEGAFSLPAVHVSRVQPEHNHHAEAAQ